MPNWAKYDCRNHYYAALGVVGEGPLGEFTDPDTVGVVQSDGTTQYQYVGPKLDGQPHHGFVAQPNGAKDAGKTNNSYGWRKSLGADPAVLIDMAKLQNSELRAYWEIQDSLKLSDQEGEQIGLHYQPMHGGGQAPLWDAKKKLDPETREFEFSKDQFNKLKKVVQQADLNAAQRTWLEPLMDQLEA